ncbi:MAG: hypothetical protein COA79_14060 [Planctomycetota bacterium]|nr:MAG: hypothetical protein COA79_14060 [Planctomycetota bacterium]
MPTKNPKYLRGDPKIPYEKNMVKARKLAEKYVRTSHEPIYFHKIRGSWTKELADSYKIMFSASNAKVMQELGIHLRQRIHFFKGFGIDFEKTGIETAIRFSKLLHKNNLMTSVYIGGTMFTQYFYKEVPEAKEWARKCQDGQKCTYSSFQLARYFPCLNNPEYVKYTYRVLDIAIDQVETDEIFFDNQILRHEPRSCRCEYCIQHLNDMIRKKYTLDECEERYGVREYPNATAPQWSQANKPWRLDAIKETHIQDWVDHRVSMLKEFYDTMKAYIYSKRKNIAVGMNIKGIHGNNRGFDNGVDHGVVTDAFDFSCIDGYSPSYKDGVLKSEIRFFKAAHSNHMAIESDFSTDFKCAENQVFNYKKFIPGHGWLGDMGDCPLVSRTAYYFRENQQRLMDKEHIHEVAILRSYPSVNYNCATVHENLIPLEQTLIMNHVPFGIIFDENIKQLDRHKVIVLGEQQALSDKWLDALEKFMKKGGGVIATGNTAKFNHWYRERKPTHGLTRFLGHAPRGEYEVAKIGKGKFVYIPKLDVHMKWDISDWYAIHGDGYRPVKNEMEVLKALKEATVIPLSYELSAPKGIIPEGIWVKKDKELDVHFLNNGDDELDMYLKVALPKGKKKATAKYVNPDRGINESIDVAIGKTFVSVKVDAPETYSCVQIKFT